MQRDAAIAHAPAVDLDDIDIVNKSDLETSLHNDTFEDTTSRVVNQQSTDAALSLVENERHHVTQDGRQLQQHTDDNGIFHDAQDNGNFHQQFSPQFDGNFHNDAHDDTLGTNDVIASQEDFMEASQEFDDNDDVNMADDLTEGAMITLQSFKPATSRLCIITSTAHSFLVHGAKVYTSWLWLGRSMLYTFWYYLFIRFIPAHGCLAFDQTP